MSTPAAFARALGRDLRAELQSANWRRADARKALRQVAAVALAVQVCHLLGLQDSWWAAISAFTVAQVDWSASLYRAVLRILGTVGGALLAWQLGPLLVGREAAFVAAMALAAGAGLYAALAFAHGYAWVLALVTFCMVLCEAFFDVPALFAFARERVADVAVGSAAWLLVAWLTGRSWRAAAPVGPRPWQPEPLAAGLRRPAAWHAAQGALAVALLAVVLCLADLRPFAQAMVTSIAVLVIPAEGLARDPQEGVMRRMVQRLAGCLGALALAGLLLPALEGYPLACQLALAAGVWCAAYLQGGGASLRYAALQFGVGFILVFVQDHGWQASAGPVLQRMGGMLAGVVVLALVMGLASAWRRPAAQR